MQTINVNSTVAQADGFVLEVAETGLLANRYFPTGDGDNFVGKEVLFDFEDADLEKGAFLTTTYKSGETLNWRAESVIPPRVANQDSVDPKGLDRVIYERLCRAQGADLNRNDAFQNLLNIKAARLAKRTDRSIELLAALVLSEGQINFDQPHSNQPGAEDDHIEIKFYDPAKGCDNHYSPAVKWDGAGSNAYEDVCNMVSAMVAHGRRPTDILMGSRAWLKISKDEAFKQYVVAYHSEGSILSHGEVDGAQHCGQVVCNGVQLNLICYAGAYKDATGALKSFIDPNAVIVIAEGCGRTLQGGCTLLNPNSIGYGLESSFIDLTGRHCSSIFKDFNNQTLYIREESRPLPAPRHSINNFDWVYCDTSRSSGAQKLGVVYNGLEFKCVDTSGSVVTPTTAPACSAEVVIGGETATITPAAEAGKTFKYYAQVSGAKGAELTLTSNALNIPLDADREDGKAIIICEQNG